MCMDFNITVENTSKLRWIRNMWVCGTRVSGVNWADDVVHEPESRLRPLDGRTAAAADIQKLKVKAADYLYMTLGYMSAAGDEFAITLARRSNGFDSLPRGEWAVFLDNEWIPGRGMPITWLFRSCIVVCTPSLVSEAYRLHVVISDLEAQPSDSERGEARLH